MNEMTRHHYSKKPTSTHGAGYRQPRQVGVRRSDRQARTLSGRGDVYSQRRLDVWDKGVEQVEREMAEHRRYRHDFTALRGADLCLICGATEDQTLPNGNRIHRLRPPVQPPPRKG